MTAETTAPGHSGRSAVLGIDIGGTKTALALATATGTIIRRVQFDTSAELGPQQALDRIAVESRLLLSQAAELGLDVLAVGGVCAGVIQQHHILHAPNLPGWGDVALGNALRGATGVESVAVMNDVQGGALAEARYGALVDCNPGIYVNLGTGLAAVLIVRGHVVMGAHSAAGEIGYHREPGQLGKSAFGDHADLEELIGGRALADRARVVLGQSLDSSELFARTDPVARHLIHQGLGALGATLATLATFTDPQRIVVGGGLMASAALILPILTALVAESVPFPPAVVTAHFIKDASLYGAVALAADTLLPPRMHIATYDSRQQGVPA